LERAVRSLLYRGGPPARRRRAGGGETTCTVPVASTWRVRSA